MNNSIKVVLAENGRLKFAKSSNFSYYVDSDTIYKEKGFKYNIETHNSKMIYTAVELFQEQYKISSDDKIVDVNLKDDQDINPEIVDILLIDWKLFIVFESVIDGSPTKNNLHYDIYMQHIPSLQYKANRDNMHDYILSIVKYAQDVYQKKPIFTYDILEDIDMYDEDSILPYKSYDYVVKPSLLLGPAFDKISLYIRTNTLHQEIYKIECANPAYTSSLLKTFPENIPYQDYILYANHKDNEKTYRIELSYGELLKYIGAESSSSITSTFYLSIPKYKLKTVKNDNNIFH